MNTDSNDPNRYKYGKYSKYLETFFVNSYLTFPELFWSISNLMINNYIISLTGKYSFIVELITTFVIALVYKFIYLNNMPAINNDVSKIFKFRILVSSILFFIVVFGGLTLFKLFNIELLSIPNNSLSVYILAANAIYCLVVGLIYGIFEVQIDKLIYK